MQLSGPQPPDKPDMISGLEIRKFGSADDMEAELDLRRRAFGPIPAGDRDAFVGDLQAVADAGQTFGVFDGKRPVASARYHAMRQWWHGRSMPMAGVAGVKVAPEERGRGVGRALMTRLLAELADLGYPVSTLYPSTLPVYRSQGFEVGGARYEAVLPAHRLSALAAGDLDLGPAGAGERAGVAVRRAGPGDAAEIVEVLGRVHQTLNDNGANTREPGEMARWLDDEELFAYLAEDGVLAYSWANGHQELVVDYAVAASGSTTRTFWQILGSHATMAETVRACLSPADPIGWLTREPSAVTTRAEDWMLRVINPKEAIAARGYPAGVTLAVALELSDTALPANSGSFLLEITEGAGQLTAAGGRTAAGVAGRLSASAGGPLRLGARGFAALFAGVPLGTLRRVGLAAGGDPVADTALDSAFAGLAFMTDYF